MPSCSTGGTGCPALWSLPERQNVSSECGAASWRFERAYLVRLNSVVTGEVRE